MASQDLTTTLKIDDRTGAGLSAFGDKLSKLGDKVKGFNISAWGLTAVWAAASIWGAAVLWLWIAATNTAWKFEKFQTILANTFGSTKEAAASMQLLKEVSSQTPFELDRLTEAYIKLVNRWFKPTRSEIVSLWDLAASLGKDFDMLVEALLDAQTWEYERLKEFWVRAQQSGDKVSFTFKWVTTTVKKTDEAIRDYVLSLWNLQGVQGSMAVQSGTFEGKISNLKDAWTNMTAAIGVLFLPVAKEAIDTITNLLNTISKFINKGDDLAQQQDYLKTKIQDVDKAARDLENQLVDGWLTLDEYKAKSKALTDEKKLLQAQVEATSDSTSIYQSVLDKVNKTKIIWNYDVYVTERQQIMATIEALKWLQLARAAVFKAQVDAQNALDKTNAKNQANVGTGKSWLIGQGSLADLGQFQMTQVAGFQATLALMDKEKTSIESELDKSTKEFERKFGEAEKKVQNLGNLVWKTWWWSSKANKDADNKKQLEQEKALLQVTAQRLQEVEKLKVSEITKAKLIVSINQDAEDQLKKIRGDDIKDQEGYFSKLKETAQDKLSKVKDSFKWMYEAVKGSISKSKDEFDKLTDKIQQSLDKIKSLQDAISEVNKDTNQSLADRFVDINKELADAYSWSNNFESIADAEKFNKRLSDLQREREFIVSKIWQEAADKATKFSELTPAEQLIEKANMKKAELQLQIDSENDKVKLLEQQRKDEADKMEKFNQTKQGIEKKYTKLFKDELTERTEAFAWFIRDIEALESASKSGIKNLIETQTNSIAWQRAYWGTIEAWKSYVVWENGPEILTTPGGGKITPNSGIWGNTTVNNYFNITVAKEVDGDKFIAKVKKELINDAKLYPKWINA